MKKPILTIQTQSDHNPPATSTLKPATARVLDIGLSGLRYLKRRSVFHCALVLAAALLICQTSAIAATINYTLTSGPDTITLAIPQNPTPNPATPNAFDVNPLSAMIDGTTYNNALVGFFTPGGGGGVSRIFPVSAGSGGGGSGCEDSGRNCRSFGNSAHGSSSAVPGRHR